MDIQRRPTRLPIGALSGACLAACFLSAAPVQSAAGATDDLAPLVAVQPIGSKETDVSDPSSVPGEQLRPPSATIHIGASIVVRLKTCFPASDGPSEYIECNHRAVSPELAPLINVHPPSGWQVNGIEGGNDTIGRVVANGRDAIYTAPRKAPSPATVAVSAELASDDEGSSLVVSNITIIDTTYYHGTVQFTGEFVENEVSVNHSGTAQLVFNRAETFEGGERFDLDPQATRIQFDRWDVTYDGESCSLKRPATRRSRYAPFTGSLFLYTAPQSYVFSTLLEVEGVVVCGEGDDRFEEAVSPKVALNTSTRDTDPGFQPLGDGQLLEGTTTLIMWEDDYDSASSRSNDWTLETHLRNPP